MGEFIYLRMLEDIKKFCRERNADCVDCPLSDKENDDCLLCGYPCGWNLEDFPCNWTLDGCERK